MSNIIQTEQIMFRNIYIHIHNNECMHVTTMNENGHEFERGKGRVCGKIWRKIKERRNGVII